MKPANGPRRIDRRSFLISCSLPLLCVAGCGSRPAAPLRVGMFPWIGYEPILIARDLGYYDKQPVEVLDLSSATQVLRAFRNGAIEAASLTMDEVLLLSQDIPDLRVILVFDLSNGADVVLGKPEIGSLADLRGKKVAYEATALGAYMLSRALEEAGLRAGDVTAVSAQIDEHERVYREGGVDAVVTFEPARSRILAQGARILFDSSKMPNEIVDVLVIRDQHLKASPDVVRALIRGWSRALRYMAEHEDDALARIGPRQKLSKEELRAALALVKIPDLAENRRLLGGSPPPLLAPVRRLADHMLGHKLLQRPADVGALLASGPVLAVQPE